VIARHRGEYPLTLMCRVLAVARSGFHAWATRPPSRRAQRDAALRVQIAATHRRSREAYGARSHQKELADAGIRLSRRRTRRLMEEAGCVAVQPRRWRVTTQADPRLPVAPNRPARQFTVTTPNCVWAADPTYCWTQEGWLFLAVVLDRCSRRIVGWATSASPDHEVALTAWRRAVALRQPAPGLLHHSDRGSTYACRPYRDALRAAGAVPQSAADVAALYRQDLPCAVIHSQTPGAQCIKSF
jgi:transposase InsO family protein